MKVWIGNAFSRIYPQTQAKARKKISLIGALNERQAFQVAIRNESAEEPENFVVSIIGPGELKFRIRRIGYVPLPCFNTPVMDSLNCEGLEHIPGYVPDPLFDENRISVPPLQTHAFWIDVRPKRGIKPGLYHFEVSVSSQNNKRSYKLKGAIELVNLKLKPRQNFHVTHWFYTDSIIDWYKTDGYDEKFWHILPAYFKNLADHGQDTVLVPLFTPPLDGVKTPCQLLKVSKKSGCKYNFDFSDVERFITIAQQSGLKYFEWSHLVTQWGAENAIRIYESKGKAQKLLWKPETKALSTTYKNFLIQLLPKWYEFIKNKKLLKNSFFHLSDEPHGEKHLENYTDFRNFLKEYAPWMKMSDALSEINFALNDVTDMPIVSEVFVMDFIRNKIPCWVYYCCKPRGKFLNRLLDTPLAKIAMHGLLFYRWPIKGFLHWGYNFWYQRNTTTLIDPFTVSDAYDWPEWAHGDTFLVYPGESGPIDSIRWEVFALSLQDYALMEAADIARNDKNLEKIKNFEDFPKQPEWRLKFRKKILTRFLN